MGIDVREKGKRAEREVCHLLQPVVNEEFAAAGKEPPKLERNLLSQARDGGCDVVGLDWLGLEVKNHAETTGKVPGWWEQTKSQAGSKEPILIYKKTGGQWKVRMFGYLLPTTCDLHGYKQRVRCPVDISITAFLAYMRVRIRHELAN